MKKKLLMHIKSLQCQIEDAYKEGKLDESTYHSILIEVCTIKDLCDLCEGSVVKISKEEWVKILQPPSEKVVENGKKLLEIFSKIKKD